MTEIIINADDFGISKGVNEAIIKMHKEGNLQSASLMISGKYVLDAVEKAKQNPALKIGLHFNLTTGKSILHPISLPLLVDDNGFFKNGFVKLLSLSIFRRSQFLHEVEAEMKAQIEICRAYGLKLSHIDGHRHVHYIFGIFSIAENVAKKENISRIRVINENIFNTLKLLKFPPISGIIKWFILRFLGLLNGASKYAKENNSPYFFSIIHSCRITNNLMQKMNYSNISKLEIMLHPSLLKLDSAEQLDYEKQHLTSKFREKETNFIKPKI